MLPSKILKHERNMIIGLLPSPVVCGWCGYPALLPLGPSSWTRVVLAGHYQPLTLVGRCPPSCPVWPGAWWMIQAGLASCVLWVAMLRGWLVCCGCDVLWGYHFLIIYNTVWIHPDLECFGIVQVKSRNPCIIHLKAFVLYIAPTLLCYFGRIIFLEYDSGLGSNWHYLLRGSLTVAGLFWKYKRAPTASFRESDGKTSELFPRWGFLWIWDLAMI